VKLVACRRSAAALTIGSVTGRSDETRLACFTNRPVARCDNRGSTDTSPFPGEECEVFKGGREPAGEGGKRGSGFVLGKISGTYRFPGGVTKLLQSRGFRKFHKKKFCTPLSPNSCVVSGGDACQDILGLQRKTSKPSAFTPFARWRRCCPQAL